MAAGWSISPAGRCRCNTARSSPSIRRRGRPPACSTSRTWAACGSTAAGAEAFLDRLLTRKVIGMAPGKIRYSLVCNESGGILDDVLVYHLAVAAAWRVLPAGRQRQQSREDLSIGSQARWPGDDVKLDRQHDRDGHDRRPGPAGDRAVVQPLAGADDQLTSAITPARKRPSAAHAGIVSRTGYTGEDGCELIVPAETAVTVWESVLQR